MAKSTRTTELEEALRIVTESHGDNIKASVNIVYRDVMSSGGFYVELHPGDATQYKIMVATGKHLGHGDHELWFSGSLINTGGPIKIHPAWDIWIYHHSFDFPNPWTTAVYYLFLTGLMEEIAND